MRQEEMEQTKRYHSESHRSGRRDQEYRHTVSSEVRVLKNTHSHQVAHTHHKYSRSDHPTERNDSSKRQKVDVEFVESERKPKNHRAGQRLNDRVGHRNSPIELVYSGCRNTDSSSISSSEGMDGQNGGPKRGGQNSKKDDSFHDSSKKYGSLNDGSKKAESSNHNSRKGDGQAHNSKKKGQSQSQKRNRREESFKELSDRKKQIELELKALDAEEAAQAQRKKTKRNPSNHHEDKESHAPVRSVRIKREPLSDDDNHHRRKAYSSKRPIHIKREPVSDDDQSNRRSQTDHRPVHSSSRVKPERDSSSPQPHRLHSSSNSRRRWNAPGRSDEGNVEWGRSEQERPERKEPREKEKPDFNPSGKLAEDTNTFNGVVIKYNEPAEARKPRRRWRLYPFKGDTSLPFIPIHRQSAYLLGRSRIIADIPIDHPSCSKQHAVLQFRLTPYTREDGTKGRSVRPYVIDLDSSNGTYINNKRIDSRRYMELFEKDVLKFGFSSRVYVILHEDSKNEDENDDDEEEN